MLVVDAPRGPVRGRWRETGGSRSAAFLGIPFAQPPVGELRFAAPKPVVRWTAVRDATAYGPTAQRIVPGDDALIPEPSIPGESTLNVNVFTPTVEAGTALPVMVWIHGGGFTAGSPASPWYDGRAFNRDGVVTVTVSYRLGFDGFGWIDGAPHNRAVLDWLAALEWVQANIVAFGGDPSRVTIAGQSAGGGAVLTLLGMPAAQHLFHSVYCLSGATADVRPEKAAAFARKLAARAGVEPSLSGFRSVPEERLLQLQYASSGGPRFDPLAGVRTTLDEGLPLGPVVDGDLVPLPVVEAIAAGVGSDKPLVLGSTDDEFSHALDAYKNYLRFVPTSLLLTKLGLPKATAPAYRAGNRETAGTGTAAVVGRFITDRVFRALVVRVAAARGEAPTWVYRFAWRSPVLGYAVHCLDVPFFFDCLDAERVSRLGGAAPPQVLADEIHSAAVRFVSAGDPGWPRWTTDDREAMVFGDPSAVAPHAYADVVALTDPPR